MLSEDLRKELNQTLIDTGNNFSTSEASNIGDSIIDFFELLIKISQREKQESKK